MPTLVWWRTVRIHNQDECFSFRSVMQVLEHSRKDLTNGRPTPGPQWWRCDNLSSLPENSLNENSNHLFVRR